MKSWLIYGAYGYSGRLIATEAAKRNYRPILAGRHLDRLKALAASLQLPWRHFDLTSGSLHKNLADIDIVLHCAGPFSVTSRPMVEACLQTGTHYLDITGELEVFEWIHQQDERAKAAGVLLLPGVGLDVIPTDCMALTLKQALPDATHLSLALDFASSMSPGTAKTSLEGLIKGGKVRRNGRIIQVPSAYKRRRIDFGDGHPCWTVTIPWGDVATAFYTTGIPNIETYMRFPLRSIRAMGFFGRLSPLLGFGPIQAGIKYLIGAVVDGPDAAQREQTPARIFGAVRNKEGKIVHATQTTANGYEFTVEGALAVVALIQDVKKQGAHTPAGLFGSNLASSLPGSSKIKVFTPTDA